MKKPENKADQDRKDVADRKALQRYKIAESRNAYPKVKKTWDFGKLGTKQVLDTTRQTERKKR